MSLETGTPDRSGATGRRGWRRTAAAPGPRPSAALAVIAADGLLVSLTQTLLVPVLPRLTADLHTTSTSAEWLLTSALLVGAVAVPVIGRLADLYGKQKLLLVSPAAL